MATLAWDAAGSSAVIYELHIGTFTQEGTFEAVRLRVCLILQELGM